MVTIFVDLHPVDNVNITVSIAVAPGAPLSFPHTEVEVPDVGVTLAVAAGETDHVPTTDSFIVIHCPPHTDVAVLVMAGGRGFTVSTPELEQP